MVLKLISDLIQLQPFNAKLAHYIYIYTLSDVAKIEIMTGKFANSVRTILIKAESEAITATGLSNEIDTIDKNNPWSSERSFIV